VGIELLNKLIGGDFFYGLAVFDFCWRSGFLHESFTGKLVYGIVEALLGGDHACSCLPANLGCISVLHEI
jgi:hypothetical protein